VKEEDGIGPHALLPQRILEDDRSASSDAPIQQRTVPIFIKSTRRTERTTADIERHRVCFSTNLSSDRKFSNTVCLVFEFVNSGVTPPPRYLHTHIYIYIYTPHTLASGIACPSFRELNKAEVSKSINVKQMKQRYVHAQLSDTISEFECTVCMVWYGGANRSSPSRSVTGSYRSCSSAAS
jgi:hypothetical protein